MDIKKVVLTLAVGILLAFFFGFLVDAAYPSPNYNDFCTDERRPIPQRPNNDVCPDFQASQKLFDSCGESGGYVSYVYDSSGCPIDAFCETCSVDWSSAKESHSRNLFYILIPISIVLIVIGLFLKLESIGSGFILGGILTASYATIRVFGDLSRVMRVVLLGIELVIVIVVGYIKIEKASHNKGNKKK